MSADHSTRIADHFLEERAQLGAALFSLSSLADESLATLPAAASLRAVQAHLRRPFVFLAVGEASSGKSSLLNALFGREFSDPDEQRTSVFKYGEHPSDTPLTSSLVERCRPLPFLRDFQLVDTAAASAILSDHEARIEEFAPVADLILFVVSVVDPWSESAWELIEAVYEKHRKEIVIAVQHADERPEREVEAICRHLERMALSRLGHEFPVCPVSARSALLARTSGLDRDRLWRQSGFARLEASIDAVVGGAHGRGADLPVAASAGRAVLQGIAAGVRQLVLDVGNERTAIVAADDTIAQAEAACRAVIDDLRERLQTATARCTRQGENVLKARVRQARFPTFPGSKTRRQWARMFHRKLTGLLQRAVDEEVETALNAMIAHFQSAADRLLVACESSLQAVGADRYRQAAQSVSERCRQLAEEVELTLVEHLAQDTVESQVQRLLSQSSARLHMAVAFGSAGLMAAIGTTTSLLPAVGLVGAVTGALLATAAAIGASAPREEALKCFKTGTPQSCASLISAIDSAFQTTLADCCAQLRAALEPLCAHCARRADRVQPISDQVESLENVFRRIVSRS